MEKYLFISRLGEKLRISENRAFRGSKLMNGLLEIPGVKSILARVGNLSVAHFSDLRETSSFEELHALPPDSRPLYLLSEVFAAKEKYPRTDCGEESIFLASLFHSAGIPYYALERNEHAYQDGDCV